MLIKLTNLFRVTLISFIVGFFLAGSTTTASAKTDKKETTKKTWSVDASHGTYSDAIPLEVPAFRGITPELALTYDSSNGNGEVGVGWSLNGVGVIERASPGKGAPNYDEADIFLLNGQELVACAPNSVSPSCTTGGTHSTKIENYERIALYGTRSSSRWTITAKDGIQRVYAPIFSLNDGVDVYKWGLHKVIDTKGNVVTYSWGTNELGCCWEYLDSITYNGTTITVHYETRPDHEFEAIGHGAMRTVHGRIKTIDVTVSGIRLRAYKLSYKTSDASSRSLLASVQQFGTDATLDGSGTITGGTSLPAIVINYQANTPAFTKGSHDLIMNNSSNAQSFAIDINGDGKTDMLELYPSWNEMRRRAWISNGSGFDEMSDEAGMSSNSNTRFLPMDVDGDGKTDIVELYPNWNEMRRRIWLSNGSGFTEVSNECCETTTSSENARYLAMDVNGDGKSDLVELHPSAWFQPRGRRTWLSTGTGFIEASDEPFDWDKKGRYLEMDINGDGKSDLLELTSGFGGWNRRIWLSHGTEFSSETTDFIDYNTTDEFIPMDTNGDGKSDLLQIHSFATVNYRRVWLSTGDSFTLSSDEPGALFSSDNWYVAIDVNGDGKSDLIELDNYGFGLYRRQIWLSEGNRFVADMHDTDIGFNSSTKLMAADVDGDGLSEMIELYPAGLVKGRRVWLLTGGMYPDLLASAENSLGGTTSVSYTPSSAWDNTNNPPPMQTATAVTVNDGRGGSATTTYEYAGGLHDRLEKRFLGFRYHVETLPCIEGESACPYIETWFRQDYGAASKPERIDRRDGSGQLLSSEIYEYMTNGATVPWTSLPTGEWGYTYIEGGAECPGAECKRTYTNRTFNEYGELAVEVDYGDYDTSGDERTLTTTFVPNTEAYIVSKPAEAKTFEGVGIGGTLLNETLSYYDGAMGWNQAPSAGFPTTTARWLSNPNSFVETHTKYDDWGNIIAKIDAVGARTEFTYDSTYHLFETSKTNALDQTITTTWNVICGVPTQTTDLNEQVTAMTYDPLCRMTERVEPSGMFERYTWVNLGDPSGQYEFVETPAADATTDPLWTQSYFDGYRRIWRTVTKGPDATTGDIYVDTVYNARGQEASVTAAYYRVSGEAQPATYATISSYDSLDRLTRVTYPDGVYTSKTYGLWSVTDTDELGHAKTDHFNANDERIAHDEVIDGEIQTTTYIYDARGHLLRSTDPLGNVITYETDSLGRQTQLDDPDRGTWIYEYDGTDRLTVQTDAKGQRTELSHDALGRKISKISLANTGTAVTVSWTYDEARDGYFNIGKLTTMIDEAGSETFDHNVAGNVVKTVRTIDGESYTFEHSFDEGGRKLWTIYPDGDTLGTPSAPLEYDGAGRLKSIPGFVDAAIYNADGKLTQLNNANGTMTIRQHSPERGWLTAISTTSGETTIQDLMYTRNAKGMIIEVTSSFENEGWTYEYDELDRLIAATNMSSSEYNQTLEYDAIGNITYNSRLGEYSYGGAQPHAVTMAGSNTYDYDAGGLMVSSAGRTLTWDGDNQLASISGALGILRDPADPSDEDNGKTTNSDDVTVDGDNPANGCGMIKGRKFPMWGWLVLIPLLCIRCRREGGTVPRLSTRLGIVFGLVGFAVVVACSAGPGSSLSNDNPPSSETDSSLDTDNQGSITTIIFTYDANGARIQQVEGAITRRHLGDGYEIEVGGSTIKYISLAGSIVARKESDMKTWVHTDHLGSIQAATDASGIEMHRKKYHPYGEILSTDGTLAFEPRGYTGQRHDASDLVYLHARYYDPSLARFISPDSIVSGSDTFGLNRYAYASNDPVNNTDVDGHSPKKPDPNDPTKARKALEAAKKAAETLKKYWKLAKVMGLVATAAAGPGPTELDAIKDVRSDVKTVGEYLQSEAQRNASTERVPQQVNSGQGGPPIRQPQVTPKAPIPARGPIPVKTPPANQVPPKPGVRIPIRIAPGAGALVQPPGARIQELPVADPICGLSCNK